MRRRDYSLRGVHDEVGFKAIADSRRTGRRRPDGARADGLGDAHAGLVQIPASETRLPSAGSFMPAVAQQCEGQAMIEKITVIQESDLKGVSIRLIGQYPIHGLPIEFYRVSSSSLEGRLLLTQVQEQLAEMFERVRMRAYEQGWRDKASRKVKKQTWFHAYTGLTDKEKA